METVLFYLMGNLDVSLHPQVIIIISEPCSLPPLHKTQIKLIPLLVVQGDLIHRTLQEFYVTRLFPCVYP